jgi:hypothetical protein
MKNFLVGKIMTSAHLFQIQSIIIIAILTFGISKRKNRAIHMKTMWTAIIWDLLLVLQIELNRGAIFKASKALSNPLILNFHVTMAVLCVVGYFFLLYSGRLLNLGETQKRIWHKRIGFTTYALRLITFITSFWAVIPKE